MCGGGGGGGGGGGMRIELDDKRYVCPKFVGLVTLGCQEVVSVFVKSLV